jgi:hypothetical protein
METQIYVYDDEWLIIDKPLKVFEIDADVIWNYLYLGNLTS